MGTPRPILASEAGPDGLAAGSAQGRAYRRSSLEAAEMLLRSLGSVEAIARGTARRWGLSAEQTEDFESWVKLQLVEDDYEVLRRFAGKSRLETYLTVVIRNLARDYRAQEIQRFRPSRSAERRGIDAIELERLIYLEGRAHDEAIEILCQNHGSRATRTELARLIAELPSRTSPRSIGADRLEAVATDGRVDRRIRARDLEHLRARLSECLDRARSAMTPTDRQILELRFLRELKASEIADLTGLTERHVYRRCYRLLGQLRAHLEVEGLCWRELSALVGWDG